MKNGDLKKFKKILDDYKNSQSLEEKMVVKFLSMKFKLEDLIFQINNDIAELRKDKDQRMKIKCISEKNCGGFLLENKEYSVIIEGGDTYYISYRKTNDKETLYGWFDKKLFKTL